MRKLLHSSEYDFRGFSTLPSVWIQRFAPQASINQMVREKPGKAESRNVREISFGPSHATIMHPMSSTGNSQESWARSGSNVIRSRSNSADRDRREPYSKGLILIRDGNSANGGCWIARQPIWESDRELRACTESQISCQLHGIIRGRLVGRSAAIGTASHDCGRIHRG